jgi:SAM-dependent methyltransferase
MTGPSPKCPVCGDVEGRMRFRDKAINTYRIRQCAGCHLAFAIPRPTPAELERVYGANYFDGGALGYADYNFLPELNARNMWPKLKADLGTTIPRTGSLLDVGCATGGFLAAAQADGWEVHGTELASSAAERARSVNGVRVEQGRLVPEDNRGPFTLITMWHVLEHLINPRDELKRLSALLETSSGILFIELPNWNSAGRFLRGRSWSQLTPPEHINYFTPRALRTLLETVGLNVIRAYSVYPSVDLSAVPEHDRARIRRRNTTRSIAGLPGTGGVVRAVARSC